MAEDWRPPGEPGPRCTRTLRLRQGVRSVTAPDGAVALVHDGLRGERLGTLTAGEAAVLQQLATGEHTERDLLRTLAEHDGTDRAAAGMLLPRLHVGGWLTVHLGHEDHRLLSMRPLARHRDLEQPRGRPPAEPRLCRFAVLRREGDALAMESPLSDVAVTVHDPRVLTLLHHLAAGPKSAGRDAADRAMADPVAIGLPSSIVSELVAELAWCGFVREAGEDTLPDLAVEQWGGHELWFHSRSRAGAHDLPFGVTNWADGRFTPLPARREPFPAEAVRLPTPDLDAMADPPLSAVMNARRSVRSHDATRPLTLDQLGEFLYRSARVTRVAVAGLSEETLRPSASGGALHSLEIYPLVTDMAGLPAGMYHYDPFDHALEPVPADGFALTQLAGMAGVAVGLPGPPQVLLLISARFGRVMWKYQSMGYALILKDLGALMQTMYLVATAMGLAPCAIGSGDSRLFANATGADPLAETSVGEFALGSRRLPDRP